MQKFEISLITSFDCNGVLFPRQLSPLMQGDRLEDLCAAADEELRRVSGDRSRTLSLELYLAMEPDLTWLAQQSGRAVISGKPQFSAGLFHQLDEDSLQRSARLISDTIEQRCGKRNICALATFIPEIVTSLPERRPTREHAIASLVGVLKIAGFLRKDRDHTSAVVEIVGGSLVRSVKPCNKPADGADVSLLNPTDAMEQLVSAVRIAVLQVAPFFERLGIRMPTISIEAEPGPLFVVGNSRALVTLTDKLNDPVLAPFVGLNLDTSHWDLIKAGHAWVRRKPQVQRRVAHSHISDQYAAGHLGDLPPRGLTYLTPWLALLRDLANERNQRDETTTVPYSRALSIELEGYKSAKGIVKSVRLVAQAAKELRMI